MTEAIQKYEEPVTLPVDPMIHLIERVVMDPGASIDKLERMLEMRERLQRQTAKAAYDAAIAQAKSEIPPIMRTGTVDYTNKAGERTHFRHETLDGIAKTVDPILSQHGLSYRFRSRQEDGRVHVTCIVAHRDGYAEETTLSGAPDTSGSKNNYQAVGSAVTYLQRYTLKLSLGLAAAHDDDAKGAGDDGTITGDQLATLRSLIEQSGADEAKLCQTYNIQSVDALPLSKYADADRKLRMKLAQKGGAK